MIDVVSYLQEKAPAYTFTGDNLVVTISKDNKQTSWVLGALKGKTDDEAREYIDGMIAAGLLP